METVPEEESYRAGEEQEWTCGLQRRLIQHCKFTGTIAVPAVHLPARETNCRNDVTFHG